MKFFPSLCIDNFFKKPQEIIEYSKTLNYENTNLVYGKRTKNLGEINFELFKYINDMVLSSFYCDIENKNIRYKANTYFQKNIFDETDGWVHKDSETITGIIYLNEDDTGGTSIYEKINEESMVDQKEKHKFFGDRNLDKNEVIKAKQINNNLFEKTIEYKGKFNRLVAFESDMWHAMNDFNSSQERLILITFIDIIDFKFYTLKNLRQF